MLDLSEKWVKRSAELAEPPPNLRTDVVHLQTGAHVVVRIDIQPQRVVAGEQDVLGQLEFEEDELLIVGDLHPLDRQAIRNLIHRVGHGHVGPIIKLAIDSDRCWPARTGSTTSQRDCGGDPE